MAEGAAIVAHIVEAADLGRVRAGGDKHVSNVDAVEFDADRIP